jgi:hypothetical protein
METIKEKIDPDTNNLLNGLKRLVTHVERSINQPAEEVAASSPIADLDQAAMEADTRPTRAVKTSW